MRSSIVLVGVGLWIRLGILETPVFQQLLENQKIERAPIVEVIKKQPKEIILSALLRMAEQAPFYIFTAFIFAYAVGTLQDVARSHPGGGARRLLRLVRHHPAVGTHLRPHRPQEDVPDRRRIALACSASSISAWSIPPFRSWCSSRSCLSLIPHDMQYGPQAALIAEAFTPRLRYSGASLGYQLASVIAGGPAPLIATALFAPYHSGYAIAVYIAACAVISLVSAALMPDYTGKDISAEYDENQPGSFRQRA